MSETNSELPKIDLSQQRELFGHPTGLYTLFFAEMWERFSYYGMRALLLFYMIKGFLGYGDGQAYTVYGAYTALVYMTPFIGGMLADRFLGKRIAIVFGGVLMAAGHLLMTQETEWYFFFALALLICGNGFFKPNISTTVGSLYPEGSSKRDAGFNIFYTGINLGAAMSPLLCGYVGETYGWHYGFGLATIGMLIGLAVFVMPNFITSALIFIGALASAIGMLYFRPDNPWAIGINIFVALCLMISAFAACTALSRGGLPKWAGGRPEGMDGRHDWKIYLGTFILVPVFALLVSGFSPFTKPPVDELTGVPIPVKTNDVRLKERLAKLEAFGVDQKFIDAVKEKGIEGEFKQRGKPYTLLGEDLINDVKGVSDKRVNKVLLEMMLADKGVTVGDEETFIEVAKQAKSQGIDIDKLDIAGESSEFQAKLTTALEAEFGITLTEKEKGFTNRKELLKTINEKRKTFAGSMASIFLEEVSRPAGLVLTILGLLAFGYLVKETFVLSSIQRNRMIAALILIFFQMLFFAFFEQAGSSVGNFTDRNIDRVSEGSNIDESQVGNEIKLQPTQAQLGYDRAGTGVFKLDDLELIKKVEQDHPNLGPVEVTWKVAESNVKMGVARRLDELPATIFQSFNAIFILIFALIFNWIWATLQKKGLDPNAAIKFGLGLIQLGLGFGAFWLGAQNADAIGMVAISWLTLGILLQTTGELCLSPVGLSTMTKLSPKHLVSTLMGAWFLATAFSQYLAGVISSFTSVESVEGFPPPSETVNVYGDVFKNIAITAIASGVFCALSSHHSSST